MVEADVWNADVGSYTLTVSVLEITDDHGGSAADASAMTVGDLSKEQ